MSMPGPGVVLPSSSAPLHSYGVTRTNTRQRPHPATTAKVQRWIDLVAGLLARGTPATFEDLARVVPQYDEAWQAAQRERDPARRRTRLASLKRTFERDKDELRHLGVVLQTLPDPEGGQDASTYRLRATDFYLPYLCVACPVRGEGAPRRVDRYGYRALTTLAFPPDELQAVVDAAAVVSTLGDAALHREATHALKKLAVDLPVDALHPGADEPTHLIPRARASAEVFDALGDAVRRRKAVSFRYEAPAGRPAMRAVEPWGLFFVGGHWYLAGFDRDRAARRNFRLSRMRDVTVNGQRAGSADFEIPAGFDIRDLGTARLAWELGEGDEEGAVVEFRSPAGGRPAVRYGLPVEGMPGRQLLTVRRWEPLVRWVLSFAGEVTPVSPAHLVDQCRSALTATRALYEQPPDIIPTPSPLAAAEHPNRWQPPTAAEQWRRLLEIIPILADGTPHSVEQVAVAVGTTVDVLQDDLYALVTRYDVPGGFVEGVRVFLEANEVSVLTNHFLRPMRLTSAELCALELGLAVLRQRRPPDEHPVLERARGRLRAVITRLGEDPLTNTQARHVVGEHASATSVQVVRGGIRQRRKLSIRYRGSGREAATDRTVHPRNLVASHGQLYLLAWCEVAQDLRTFRLDRVEEVTLLDATFVVEMPLDVEQWIGSGKVFRGDPVEVMRVWYAPSVAPWIAEREGREPNADGSLVLDHPVADREWAVRHVLQYADGAVVLSPPELRDLVCQRLEQMAREL